MSALRQAAQAYEHYLAEGADLLAGLCAAAHVVHLDGRLILVAELRPAVADALCNWGADLADLEQEDAA
ncbi:MAG: hypothetical protein WD928_10100 [Gammaproteobacteria bacterium]